MDNQSTTQTDPLVLEVMLPCFSENFGNPHSASHSYGWQAYEAIEEARSQVARLLNADFNEIIFTSGATESVNLALHGIAKKAPKCKTKIITVSTEHSCVLACCQELSQRGFDVMTLPVQSNGLLNLEQVAEAIDDSTLVVSVMLVNNEIGVIQSLSEVANICQKFGAYLHSDATQAVGKIPVNVEDLGVDMLSLSAHKLYGPKGIGALYVRKELEKQLCPIIMGGGQEKGLRPGTLAVPLVVGLGAACQIAAVKLDSEAQYIAALQRELKHGLQAKAQDMIIFGDQDKRVPGNLNIGFPNISGDEIVAVVGEKLAVSTGSACSSVKSDPSHVIRGLGFEDSVANTSIRISIGRFNTHQEIRLATDWLLVAAGR